jgi:lipopolysaccharide transport system permease protein
MTAGLFQVYRHRALAEILVARDLKARYRGTVLGFLWSFANPLLLMVIYVLVFRVYMRVDIPNYPAFLLSALLPWTCFVTGLTEGMQSLVNNGSLIRKVHLPSAVFPLVSVASNMTHYLLSIPVLMLVLGVSGVQPTRHLALFPVLFILQAMFTYGCTLFLASLAVQFRDLTHIVPNLTMMWFYLTPVLYSYDLVPARMKPYMMLNPMAGLIDAYRGIFVLQHWPSWMWLVKFAALSLVLMGLGMRLFDSRAELYPEMV